MHNGTTITKIIFSSDTEQSISERHTCIFLSVKVFPIDCKNEFDTIVFFNKGGEDDEEMCFPGIYFRQFMPHSTQVKEHSFLFP